MARRVREPVDEQSPCVVAAMRKASRRLTQLYDHALEKWGLRSTQYTIMYELNRRITQPPTVAELARILVMDRSTLGHNLRPLEREGFVALREGKTDRRRRHAVLTPRGRAKFLRAERLWQAAQDRFAEVFGASQAAKLRATLLGIARDQRLARLED